jgi:hypothetical protein
MHRRGKLSVNGQTTISSPIGDDTIEFELTAEQLRELSQAAEVAEPVARAQIAGATGPGRISPAFNSQQPLFKVGPSSRFRRWHLMPIAKMTGATVAYAALAWWSAWQFAAQPVSSATAAARPTVVSPSPALTTSSSIPAVRVINPFDTTEVFEFPAGTSATESREKVAQMLLQRARERHSQWEHIRPAVSLRTASLFRRP